MLAVYRFIVTAVIYTHRAIVDKSNFHHCLEHSILDSIRDIKLLHFLVEMVVELSRFLQIRSTVEVGFVPLLNVTQKGELGH